MNPIPSGVESLPKPKPPTHKDVYAIRDEQNRVKIGRSNDIWKRLSDLQTGNADELRFVHSEKAELSIAARVERGARKMLDGLGKTGSREWRNDVSDEEARSAIRTSHDIERGRNSK